MASQNAARAHKVEVVDEVKTRMSAATASIVSEYRGLTVAELAELRTALAAAGGDYKIFKNTLVRLAIDGGDYQPLSEYLSGPSALTFVQGDISAVAKALRDFARANPLLVIKGGLADGSLLSPGDLAALADLPPREVLLARLAGALAAPMQQMAGLLQALPRNMAYGISALIEQREASGEKLPEPKPRPGHRPKPPRPSPPTHRRKPRRPSPPRRRHRPSPQPRLRRLQRCAGRLPPRSRWSPPAGRRPSQRRRPPPKRPPSSTSRIPAPNRTTETEGKKGRPGRWQP